MTTRESQFFRDRIREVPIHCWEHDPDLRQHPLNVDCRAQSNPPMFNKEGGQLSQCDALAVIRFLRDRADTVEVYRIEREAEAAQQL